MTYSPPIMKDGLRRLARFLAPELLHWRRSYYLRRGVRALFGASQRFFRDRLYPGNASPVVLSGPFQGMHYLDETIWGPITPKWAGTYEMELSEIIEELVRRKYSRVLNIGCAEGYYAVGLAMRDPAVEVFAFDTDPISRMQTRRLAQLNDVSDRIHVEGECKHGRINTLISRKTLLMVDIEGYEVNLLDPVKIPRLMDTDLLIEVHEDTPFTKQATAEEQLTKRLAASHIVERRVSSDRAAWIGQHENIWRDKLSYEEIAKAIDEDRQRPTLWIWAKTKG
jgi:hypothetical protein